MHIFQENCLNGRTGRGNSFPNNKLSTDDNCCFACLAKIAGGWIVNSPPQNTWVFVENRRKCRDWRSSRKTPYTTPLSPPTGKHTYIYIHEPKPKKPGGDCVVRTCEVLSLHTFVRCVAGICWRCCCSFRSCHLLCALVGVYCDLCNKCASLLLYNDVTKSTHKRLPRRHQCRRSMFWFCFARSLDFCLEHVFVYVFRWIFSPSKRFGFSSQKNFSYKHKRTRIPYTPCLEVFWMYCAYFKSVLASVFPQSVDELSCVSFPLEGFPFWVPGFFVAPFNVSFVV